MYANILLSSSKPNTELFWASSLADSKMANSMCSLIWTSKIKGANIDNINEKEQRRIKVYFNIYCNSLAKWTKQTDKYGRHLYVSKLAKTRNLENHPVVITENIFIGFCFFTSWLRIFKAPYPLHSLYIDPECCWRLEMTSFLRFWRSLLRQYDFSKKWLVVRYMDILTISQCKHICYFSICLHWLNIFFKL